MFLSKVKVKKFAKLEEKFGNPNNISDRHYKEITTEVNTNLDEIYHVIQHIYLQEGYYHWVYFDNNAKEEFLAINKQRVLVVAKDMDKIYTVLISDIEEVQEG